MGLFGPSRKEIWKLLSAEIDGTYIEGGLWRGDKVEAVHGNWTVTLDTYVVSTGKATVPFTRMRAPYLNRDGFRFTVYRRGMFSEIAKAFGMQDVEVGHAEFDRDFIIKGTDEARLRALFANPRLRNLIEAQSSIHLEVRDDGGRFAPKVPEGVDTLNFHVAGFIKDKERLKRLYELFAETLDQLCRMGSAEVRAPDLRP